MGKVIIPVGFNSTVLLAAPPCIGGAPISFLALAVVIAAVGSPLGALARNGSAGGYNLEHFGLTGSGSTAMAVVAAVVLEESAILVVLASLNEVLVIALSRFYSTLLPLNNAIKKGTRLYGRYSFF